MWFFRRKKDTAKTQQTNRALVSIRMEAIGGQGANSAGKILAEAAVLKMGYTGNHFSSFGSEKRGTPVKSNVRFATDQRPIRTASAISKPDILVIFHEYLLFSHPEILNGADQNTDIIINSVKKPEDLLFPVGSIFKTITTVDATTLATNYKCGLNAILLGVVAELCPEVKKEFIESTMRSYFSSLPEKILNKNLKAFNEASKYSRTEEMRIEQSILPIHEDVLPQMGWLNAPLGGIVVNPGNSILKNHSASRKGVAPQFNSEICFNCGFCDMVCPDFCFVWDIDPKGIEKPQLKGIDYQYCKGCQKCITVCPVEALVPVSEVLLKAEEKSQKLFPEITDDIIEKRWKNMDWARYIEELPQDQHMVSLQTELLDTKSYLRPLFSAELIEQMKKENKKS